MRHPRRPGPIGAAWLLAALTAGVSAPLQPPVRAADQPRAGVAVAAVEVGFDGWYKVGCWTPVRVALAGDLAAHPGARLELTTADSDGTDVVYSAPLTAAASAAGSPPPATAYVRFGHVESRLRVAVVADGQRLAVAEMATGPPGAEPSAAAYRRALSTDDELLLALGADPGLAAMPPLAGTGGKAPRTQVVVLAAAQALPDETRGYDGVDAITLVAAGGPIYDALAADHPRRTSLERWIQGGGTALLAVGGEAPQLVAPGRPLDWLVPGRFVELAPLASLRPLEAYVESPARLALPPDLERLLVPRLDDVQGRIVAAEADLPLAIRQPRAFGVVAFLGLDLDRPPLAEWPSRGALVSRLLGRSVMRRDAESSSAGGQVTWLGFTDLAGQLHGALDRFAGVRLVPFWVVAVLAGLYVLAVGPLDFLLVRYVLRRMELTWLTFPLAALLLAGGAYALAAATKGDRLRLNQLDVVDFDAAAGLVRSHSWFNLFSPQTAAYDLAIRPELPSAVNQQTLSVELSWRGLPGAALGGMEAPVTSRIAAGGAYRQAPDGQSLVGVPLAVWSSKAFESRWLAEAAELCAAELAEDADGVPRGTLVHRCDGPLENALLAYGRWALTFSRPLEPGVAYALSETAPGLERTELSTRLTQRAIVHDLQKNEFVQVATPYDRAAQDPAAIARQMMFHEASGGLAYAALTNRYRHGWDLSRQLGLGRAILVARLQPPAAGIEIAGHRRPAGEDFTHQTVVRLVLPVAGRTGAP